MKEESTKVILHSICQQTGKDGTDANEKDWDAEMTRVKEKEWFARHPQYKNILNLCGIDKLMDTMISLLAQKMITEIPVLVREMRERKAEVGYENNDVFLFIWRKDAPGRWITRLPEPPCASQLFMHFLLKTWRTVYNQSMRQPCFKQSAHARELLTRAKGSIFFLINAR